MACYLISYDLGGPNRNYEAVIDTIKSFGAWAHVTESFWAVVSDSKAKEIRDALKAHLDSNDRLIVVKSGTEAAWSNVICSNEWLKKNL